MHMLSFYACSQKTGREADSHEAESAVRFLYTPTVHTNCSKEAGHLLITAKKVLFW